MSTSHNDSLVNLLSRYLARHLADEELLVELDAIGTDGLGGDPAELVGELVNELRAHGHKRGYVEVLVRETLEAIALG
jgi:hypothetical protein